MVSVHLNDNKIAYDRVYQHYQQADQWAKEHCAGYLGYEALDISDVSLTNDVIAEYLFSSEKDAALFSLKWK